MLNGLEYRVTLHSSAIHQSNPQHVNHIHPQGQRDWHMNERARPTRRGIVLRLGAIILAALHGLGIYAYVTRSVLKHPWIWDNPDYMLYLYTVYYHLHT